MQEASLPSPDIGAKGFELRRAAVRTISQMETSAFGYTGGGHPGAGKLAAFFEACRDAALVIGGGIIIPVDPTDPNNPEVPIVYPSVSMQRRDVAKTSYPDADEFGFTDTNLTAFDIFGNFPSGDAAGEYSTGAKDAANRFYVDFGGQSGKALRIYRAAGGNTTLIATANIRQIGVNEVMRIRVERNPTAPEFVMISVFLGSELVLERGNLEPLPGGDGTKFYWHSIATPSATNITSSSVTNPLKLGLPRLSGLHDGRAYIPLEYSTTADQPNPTGLEVRQRSLSGDTLTDWEPALLVASSGAGQLDIVAPTAYSGTRPNLVLLDVRHKAVPAITATSELYYPEPLRIGQNIASITGFPGAYRSQAVWSNMFMQGYWQEYNTAEKDTPGRNTPGKIDEMGWPLKAEMWFWYRLPDELTKQTYVFEWTGGDVSVSHFSAGSAAGVMELGEMVRTGPRKIEWTIRGDRREATSVPHCRLQFDAIDTSNPPKNLKLYRKGDDITQRFLPSFIDFLKLTPGPLRFMDDTGVNGEKTRFGVPWVWANRPKQDSGAIGQLAVEDMVELAYRSNRPLHYNVHTSYAYEEGGLDYYDRELDIIYGRTPGSYSTPGFTAPGGCPNGVHPELDNEIWNLLGFGPNGSYHYQVAAANAYNLVPAFDPNNGSVAQGVMIAMRNIGQVKLMKRLQDRIPDWRSRTTRVLGVQMGNSDIESLVGDSGWNEAKNYIDAVYCAPYVPNDPNAGGQAANVPDKSPAGISTFLAKSATEHVLPILAKQASIIARLGFKFGVYEVNVSIPSLGVTLEENKALQRSQEYYNVWYNTIIPMLARFGGQQCVYSDVGPILPGTDQQWSLMHILNTDYNKSWDAVVAWSNANR